MSETGGPVYEGVGRPEQVKTGVVEKVKASIAKRVDGVKQDFSTRQAFGAEKQARVVDRYKKVLDSMNDSWLKSAAKLYEPVVRADAAIKGINAAVLDTSVKTMLRWSKAALSIMTVVAGGVGIADVKSGNTKKGVAEIIGAVALGAGVVGAGEARKRVADIRPIQGIMRKHEDAKDYIGLKGVDILNKIIGRPKAIATQA